MLFDMILDMKSSLICFLFIILASITGCNTLKKSISYPLENGRYKNISNDKSQVFVIFEDSLIKLFSLSKKKNSFFADKKSETTFLFSETQSHSPNALKLSIPSFDIDIITIPFKYRFPTKAFPEQLNTNFSGAFYSGARNDIYTFKYKQNPLGDHRRMISHFGYGAGLFAGVGSTAMNPWVTLNRIDIEYDGFVLIGGAEGVIALNRFTFGIGLGIDHLIDKNKKLWIYQGKPWLGLTIGLNLN